MNDPHGGSMTLYRQKLSDGTLVTVASSANPVTTGGAYKGINITDTSLQPVDHQHYMYCIVKCVSATESFYGARITFTYTNAATDTVDSPRR